MEVNGQLNAPATLARRKNPSTRRIWGRMGLRGGLGILVKRNTYCSCRDVNSGPSNLMPIRYSDFVVSDVQI